LVPESRDDDFVPVYAPQTALLFMPFSLLPYLGAALTWMIVTLAIYLWSLRLSWKSARDALPDWQFVMVAAFASPAIWQLAAYGQTSIVIVAAFAGAWWALERDRRALAGLWLSLIAIKPQFGLVVAPLALFSWEARLIGGVAVGLSLQALGVAAVFGWSVF